MITPWEIYWVLQLDSINGALILIAILSGLAFLGLLGAMIIAFVDDSKDVVWGFRKWAFRTLLFIFTPALHLQRCCRPPKPPPR